MFRLAQRVIQDPDARRGARDMLPFAPGIAAWGVVTGLAMVKSGLSTPLAMFMSLVVYAGSAQLATLPLLVIGAPIGVVWATALRFNSRPGRTPGCQRCPPPTCALRLVPWRARHDTGRHGHVPAVANRVGLVARVGPPGW